MLFLRICGFFAMLIIGYFGVDSLFVFWFKETYTNHSAWFITPAMTLVTLNLFGIWGGKPKHEKSPI